jgi:ABC-2 type transport system ATP-binding protein
MEVNMNIIEVKNLTKYYGKSRGIVDVSFNVKEGEIFGFIGPNGSGKSTTIRTLLELIHPTSGEATIFGKDCIKDSPLIMKNVGYLPADVFYYDGMKVIDLLNYSASFYKKNCKKRIKELAEIMDLDLLKKIEELSYGNKKKVGIVQALLHEPKLIILDEPTGGLDPLMQQNFFELLRKENKKGATIFFSSHVLSEVQKICDRVAIIKDGKIIKIENMNDINKDNYKRIKVETKDKIKDDYFEMVGVNDLKIKGNIQSFMFKGDINEVIRKASKIQIKNLWIDEPDLEEIFMHYYTKGD